jgi:hypothetical protein
METADIRSDTNPNIDSKKDITDNTNVATDEQVQKTPRQARRVLVSGKDIEMESLNHELQIRFVEDKKRVSNEDVEIRKEGGLGSNGSLVESSKKNRNRVKSESYGRVIDGDKKSVGQSIDALDLGDVKHVKNVVGRNGDSDRLAAHKVKKHRSKIKVQVETDGDSTPSSDEADYSEGSVSAYISYPGPTNQDATINEKPSSNL